MHKKNYIRRKILTHVLNHELSISDELLDEMSNSGGFSFRIIYDSCDVIKYTLLDSSMLVYDENEYNGIWSIDGGKRFQWFVKEVINIDLKEYRQYILNNLDI